MTSIVDPPLEPIVEHARQRVLATLLRWRARAVPVFSVVALSVILLDPRPWRVVLLSVAAATITAISFVELRALERGPLTPGRVRMNLVVSGLCQLGLVLGSGGLASPVAPAVVIFALVFNLSAPRRLAAAFALLVQVPAVWLAALAHALDLVPGLVPFDVTDVVGSGATGPFLTATTYTVFFVVVVVLGQSIRQILDGAVEERVAEQRRVLELHEESARTMSALSSEIAHELKNPLASIKGLAGLLRRDVEGQGRERLEVMRGEIDRMQEILEGLLNYSRPVVPLEARSVALRALLSEVRALHEGMALGRGLTLAPLSPDDVVVACDPRKVRQIVVNLVQNAIEAGPPGSVVRMGLRSEDGRAVVEVEDEGPGLDPRVARSLFEVGVTTKEKGSGIGLAVARGLARQHGGELSLLPREAGGCRARLELPLGAVDEAVPEASPSREEAA